MTHVQTVAVDHGRPSVPDHERPPKAVTASRSLCPSGSRIEETSDARAQCLDAVGNRPGFGHDRFWRKAAVRPKAWVTTFAYWALHRFAAADPGPVIRRALLDIWAVKSSILERNSLRIGEVFALL